MGGPSDAVAKIPDVTELTRSERTSQLLVARLDAVASVAAQLHHAEVERLVELASVATMHAVALETLHAEKAEEIWRDAHTRHPELPVVRIELPETLAA
jgi:ubiquinone biosynthesis protein COQ9